VVVGPLGSIPGNEEICQIPVINESYDLEIGKARKYFIMICNQQWRVIFPNKHNN